MSPAATAILIPLSLAIVCHFLVFPHLFQSAVHSYYYSKTYDEAKAVLEQRAKICDKVADDFWSQKPVQNPVVVKKMDLLIMIVTVARFGGIGFVRHTTRKLLEQVEDLAGVEMVVCNAEIELHVHPSLDGFEPRIPVLTVTNRSHKCCPQSSW